MWVRILLVKGRGLKPILDECSDNSCVKIHGGRPTFVHLTKVPTMMFGLNRDPFVVLCILIGLRPIEDRSIAAF